MSTRFRRLNRVKMTTSTVGNGTLMLVAAVSPFQTVGSAGGVDGDKLKFLIEDGSAWEVSKGVYTAAGTQLTRVLIASSTGVKLVLSGSATVAVLIDADDEDGFGLITPPQGRPTLTSGTPIMSSSVTAATTVYYTPHVGEWIPVPDRDGFGFRMRQFSELSQTTTDNTKSPAACTTNSNYDWFLWDDNGTIRFTRGPPWTSDTARGAGAGTTELARLNGLLCNANAITNGPGANLGLYVATGRTNGASQIDYILGGAGAAGGESTILGLWSAYSRIPIDLLNYDNTDNWNYTTNAWRIRNNNNNNKISFVVGLALDGISADFRTVTSNPNACNRANGIGLDATTAYAGFNSSNGFAGHSTNLAFLHSSMFSKMGLLGFHYLAPLELSEALGTTTWYGDQGANGTFNAETGNSMFRATIFA